MSDTATVEGSDLKIPLEPLIRGMSLDKKREMLAWLATDDEVIHYVVDVICGEDELGWAMGDPNRRAAILSRIEDTQLKNGTHYSWKPWDEARSKIKDIRTEEHLYWVLYHQIDPDVSRRVFDELRRLGVKDNYTSTRADAEIAAVKLELDTALAAMRQPVEGGAE
jgi:hypothetical protein